MALLYLDTSALVKLYVQEAGSDVLLEIATNSDAHRLAILALARVEFRSAVRRRERAGGLDRGMAESLIAALGQHLQDIFTVQPVTEITLDEAQFLIDGHALRAFDAVQLAGARVLIQSGGADLVFVCSDQQLCSVARAEGVTTFNPELDDPASIRLAE